MEPSDTCVPDMERITTVTADKLELSSWYKPPAGSSLQTLVYFQGNTGHMGSRDDKIRPYLDANYGALLVGYRGFSGNPGKPTEEGLYKDVWANLKFLRNEGQKANNWIFYGESLGTGVAIHIAVQLAKAGEPIAALVLEAPYTSLVDLAINRYPFVPVKRLIHDKFESANKINNVNTPTLIVHGELDTVVSIDMGKQLFAKANEPKGAGWLKAAGHNDLYSHGASEIILKFLSKHVTDISP